MNDSYHLDELRVARDRSHPGHLLPPPLPPDSTILDIGCGAGQTLIAAYPEHKTFGIDIDLTALRLGRTLTSTVAFTCGQAEALPFKSKSFDFVVARVSLAYADISRSLAEIRRVLRPGGRVWITLHPFSLCAAQARRANWKGRLSFLYIVANGLCFHFCGRQFKLAGKQESFQTVSGMRRALLRAGFGAIIIQRDGHFLVTARV
jgi:SAM-dependent methyltransferase